MSESDPGDRDRGDAEARRRVMASLLAGLRANDDARRLLIAALAILGILGAVYGTNRARWLRIPVAYGLPMALVYPLLLAALLYLRGRTILPRGWFAAGTALTAGGVILELLATAIAPPDLRREANPIARALLDSGHSLAFVYWYAIIAQGLYAALLCLLWAAFLRHRLTLVLSARRGGAAGRLAFLKAALGGGRLTWRQFLLPLRRSEMPSAYHLAWLFTAVMMGAGPARGYLGLCWLGLGSFAYRQVVMVLAHLLSFGLYLTWLIVESNKVSPRLEGVA